MRSQPAPGGLVVQGDAVGIAPEQLGRPPVTFAGLCIFHFRLLDLADEVSPLEVKNEQT